MNNAVLIHLLDEFQLFGVRVVWQNVIVEVGFWRSCVAHIVWGVVLQDCSLISSRYLNV